MRRCKQFVFDIDRLFKSIFSAGSLLLSLIPRTKESYIEGASTQSKQNIYDVIENEEK